MFQLVYAIHRSPILCCANRRTRVLDDEGIANALGQGLAARRDPCVWNQIDVVSNRCQPCACLVNRRPAAGVDPDFDRLGRDLPVPHHGAERGYGNDPPLA